MPPTPPPEPPPPPPAEKSGTVVGGCLAYFGLCWLLGFATLKLAAFQPYNLAIPLLAVLWFTLSIARHGWSRTHTGILLGMLLTLGAYLLLMSICGGHSI